MFWINLLITLMSLILGGYILFVGRKVAWITLGAMGLIVSGNLLAILFANANKAGDLIDLQAWELVGIAFLIGALGLAIGRANPDLAVLLIGFFAGADLSLWLYDISSYVIITVAQQPARVAFWIGLAIIVVGGLCGVWLVKKSRDEALILITMLVGAQFLLGALNLSSQSSWTAILIIALGLAGILVQYTTYLREIKANQTVLEPDPSSVAYFQDLELDR